MGKPKEGVPKDDIPLLEENEPGNRANTGPRTRWKLYVAAALALVVVAAIVVVLVVVLRASPRTVILISIDGFRHDYFGRTAHPHLDRIAQDGARVEQLVPVFPSLTFPNHYSLVTGLFAESHGIVGNTFYDPVFDATFSMSNNDEVTNGRWWLGEPIWVTAEKAGKRTGVFFWPGSEAEIKGVRPTYYMPYNTSVPNNERVDTVLDWITRADEQVSLAAVYFSIVDSAGHEHGPDSPEVDEAIRSVDASIGRLLAGLDERGRADDVDVIVVSDHGMSATSPERVLRVADYITITRTDDAVDMDAEVPTARARIIGTYPVGQFWADSDDDAMEIVRALSNATDDVQAWLKDDLPARFHFANSRRTPPAVSLVAPGWVMVNDTGGFPQGAHGYDPDDPSMHSVFLARGPSFRKGQTLPALQAVDVYSITCLCLGIDPAPNNGTLNAMLPLMTR